MVFSSFLREDGGVVRTSTTYLSHKAEYMAEMTVDAGSFRILGGQWEVSRPAPGMVCGREPFPESMLDREAYLSFKFPEDVGGIMPKRIVRIVRDCVRGLVQAETYLLPERGFADDKAYDDFFDEVYVGGCRAYSHPHEDEETWMQYAGAYRRTRGIFNRYKTFLIERDPAAGLILVSGALSDSFHEMHVRFAASAASGEILSSGATFKRAPMGICFSCGGLADGLVGLSLPLGKGDLAELTAGAEGCSHLFDLLCDLADESGDVWAESQPPPSA
jgi:hypothetical protein